jgi:hypothetical protein
MHSLEDLPGFQSLLEINELEPGERWDSSRAPMALTMTPKLWVPLRAVFGRTKLPAFKSAVTVFLCQQLEAMALEGVSSGDSPYLPIYNRLKRAGSDLSRDAEALASGFEDC